MMAITRKRPSKATPMDGVGPESEKPFSLVRIRAFLNLWLAPLAFAFVACLPLIRRLRHPTILGDDVIRIVDLIDLSFVDHLFRPFGNHVAPGFQFVSWVTWELIGHDIRRTPLGFSIASAVAWLLVLVLFSLWLKRETGSRTAVLVAVALVAQSPLVLETAWWYSSSSFSWAVAGVLVAPIGASWIAERPRRSLLLIGIGSAWGQQEPRWNPRRSDGDPSARHCNPGPTAG